MPSEIELGRLLVVAVVAGLCGGLVGGLLGVVLTQPAGGASPADALDDEARRGVW